MRTVLVLGLALVASCATVTPIMPTPDDGAQLVKEQSDASVREAQVMLGVSAALVLVGLIVMHRRPSSDADGDDEPRCDVHAYRVDNSCTCESGYHGDGTTCAADGT